MAQLIQYALSDGHIQGSYTSNVEALLLAQIVEEDPTYGYLLSLSEMDMTRQDEYEVLGEVLTRKIALTITAIPSPFVADGLAECAITVTPFVECMLSINGVTTALTTGDATLLLTADTPQLFRVVLPAMPGYFAEDILILAVNPAEAVVHATGQLTVSGGGTPPSLAATLCDRHPGTPRHPQHYDGRRHGDQYRHAHNPAHGGPDDY